MSAVLNKLPLRTFNVLALFAILSLVELLNPLNLERAFAQANFYQGKTITVVVASTAAGGYDLWARLAARYIGKYIPGNPSVLVQNMPGAGNIIGANYVYGILTGYGPAPAGETVQEGLSYNKYYPGHQIAMPEPLSDGAVKYTDGSPSTVAQMAHDVATFLTWASEPSLEERKRAGLRVLLFLIVFAALVFALKQRIWSRLH